MTDVHSRRYSLSIAEENKPAFLLSRNERGEAGEENSQPLETVIAMAASRDPDVRRSIAGAMYRLSMCTRLKRRFVQKGVLEPLLLFSKTSADREVQRYSMHAIQVSLEPF